MTSIRLLPTILLAAAMPFAQAADTAAAAAPAASAAEAQASGAPDMCFYTNALPADLKYTVVGGKLRESKGTYGGVAEMLPALAQDARDAGGDALVHYNGGQHFGFWPWRLAHPIVTGQAIKWAPGQAAPDCEATGGELMSKIVKTNVAPAHDNVGKKAKGAASAASASKDVATQ